MSLHLSESQKQDLLSRGFSRRTLGRIAAMLTTGAALPFRGPARQLESPPPQPPADAQKMPIGN